MLGICRGEAETRAELSERAADDVMRRKHNIFDGKWSTTSSSLPYVGTATGPTKKPYLRPKTAECATMSWRGLSTDSQPPYDKQRHSPGVVLIPSACASCCHDKSPDQNTQTINGQRASNAYNVHIRLVWVEWWS